MSKNYETYKREKNKKSEKNDQKSFLPPFCRKKNCLKNVKKKNLQGYTRKTNKQQIQSYKIALKTLINLLNVNNFDTSILFNDNRQNDKKH